VQTDPVQLSAVPQLSHEAHPPHSRHQHKATKIISKSIKDMC